MNDLKKNVKVIRQTIGTETEKTIRVGAYCRVSTDSEEQVDSFITQVKYYSDFICNSSNMILVDIYADMYNRSLIQCPAHGSIEKWLK